MMQRSQTRVAGATRSAPAPVQRLAKAARRSPVAKAAAVEASSEVSVEQINRCVNAIRFLAIDAVNKAKSGHPGLPMGCAPMSYTLFNEAMKYNPKDPKWFNRDRFVLSAGHGSMLQYALLHLTGYDSVSVSNLEAAWVAHWQRTCWEPAANCRDCPADPVSRPATRTAGRHQVVPPVGQFHPRPPRELPHGWRGGHHW
jgi:hypothetical protein